jgi:hypothetical protein
LVPLTLKRLGADPATAPSIFLMTSTDVGMGIAPGLATLCSSASDRVSADRHPLKHTTCSAEGKER